MDDVNNANRDDDDDGDCVEVDDVGGQLKNKGLFEIFWDCLYTKDCILLGLFMYQGLHFDCLGCNLKKTIF